MISKIDILKKIHYFLFALGLDVKFAYKLPANLPDKEYYKPFFSPWLGYGDFSYYYNLAKDNTLVTKDRCHILYTIALNCLNLEGDFWECGVYKGGTAKILAELLNNKKQNLCLFDTFEGMPETNKNKDNHHKKGDFADVSLESVKDFIGDKPNVQYYKGFMPDTFKGKEDSEITFAHIDVDIYQSMIDCCEFIYPRLTKGGFIVFDDYGMPTCSGARRAIDEFFSDKIETPIVLPTSQALIVKI